MSTGESDYAKRVVELSMQLANSRADVENLRMRIKAVDKEHEQLKKDRADMVDRFDAALRRAKAEVLREVKYEALGSRIKCFKFDTLYAEGNDDALNALVKWADARAAQIDADGDCTRCGLKIEPDEDTLEPHECPPGFTDPAMSGSKGLKRYNGVEQDDEGAYVYYDEHIAALRRAKAEGRIKSMWEAVHIANTYNCDHNHGKKATEAVDNVLLKLYDRIAELEADARAAQIEEGDK